MSARRWTVHGEQGAFSPGPLGVRQHGRPADHRPERGPLRVVGHPAPSPPARGRAGPMSLTPGSNTLASTPELYTNVDFSSSLPDTVRWSNQKKTRALVTLLNKYVQLIICKASPGSSETCVVTPSPSPPQPEVNTPENMGTDRPHSSHRLCLSLPRWSSYVPHFSVELSLSPCLWLHSVYRYLTRCYVCGGMPCRSKHY